MMAVIIDLSGYRMREPRPRRRQALRQPLADDRKLTTYEILRESWLEDLEAEAKPSFSRGSA